MLSRKLTDNKKSLRNLVFKRFTNEVGGDVDEFTECAYSRFDIEREDYWDDCIYHTVTQYFIEKLIPHKIHVYNAGIELMQLPWFSEFKVNKEQFVDSLWLHDLSKFSHIEALPYATHDFSKPDKGSIYFQRAWCHHKSKNEHHPEFWLNPNRKGEISPLPMPDIYIMEMFADWIGAGKTYGDILETWLPKNFQTFEFHPETKQKVQQIANYLNIEI